jgi:hypothetical protein
MVNIKRLRALLTKRDPSSKESVELSDLFSERHAEQLRAIPVPTCCSDAQHFPAVFFSVNCFYEEDEETLYGTWRVRLHDELFTARNGNLRPTAPAPKFCPFCGTALPKMQLKEGGLGNVCQTSDGNYCDTCKERLQNCTCDPMESAYEPVEPTQAECTCGHAPHDGRCEVMCDDNAGGNCSPCGCVGNLR